MNRTSHNQLVRLDSLQPHPQNLRIYQDDLRSAEETSELRESIATHGLWEGHVIVHDQTKTILHGHRRVAAAMELGLGDAVVSMVDHLPDDVNDPEVMVFLLNGNAQREKTNTEKLREFEVRKAAEQVLAKRRMAELNGRSSAPGAQHQGLAKGTSRDKAAKKCGLGSGSTAEKALQALKLADEIQDSEPEKAKAIKQTLNKSLTTGFKLAKQLTAEPAPPKPEVKIKNTEFKFKAQADVNAADGKRIRNLERCKQLEGYTVWRARLEAEMPKAIQKAVSAKNALEKLATAMNDAKVDDRSFPQYMTVWAEGWREDGYDAAKQIQELDLALMYMRNAMITLTECSHTDEVMIDRSPVQ